MATKHCFSDTLFLRQRMLRDPQQFKIARENKVSYFGKINRFKRSQSMVI